MFNVTDFLNTAFSSSSSATSSFSTQTEKDKLQRKLRTILQDESIQILSSFELNQWATLTYHEGQHSAEDDLCEALFELLQSLFLHPTQQTTLTLQKALVVAGHVLLLGAEKVMQEAQVLKPTVAALRNYNTALIQQQQQSANVWLRFKGGTVDQGGPVRELAERLFTLLSMPRHDLLRERQKHADPNSLVPVGSNQEIAFATDEQRLQYLQQRMQHQEQMQQKSNLAKADNGFGGGYSSRNGQAIVGASHSLEEMMEIARRKEAAKRAQFRDEPSTATQASSHGVMAGFADYEPPFTLSSPNEHTLDLLDWQSNQTSTVAAGVVDTVGTVDLLDLGETAVTATSIHHSSLPSDDLLSLVTTHTESPRLDPFASTANDSSYPSQIATTMASSNTVGPTILSASNSKTPSDDPFSAFDTLGTFTASTFTSFSPASLPANNYISSNNTLSPQTITDSMTAMGISNLPQSVQEGASFTKTPIAVSSSLRVAWTPGNADSEGDESSGGGFVMGGVAGSGLEPLGSAPAAPPPPPPPAFY